MTAQQGRIEECTLANGAPGFRIVIQGAPDNYRSTREKAEAFLAKHTAPVYLSKRTGFHGH